MLGCAIHSYIDANQPEGTIKDSSSSEANLGQRHWELRKIGSSNLENEGNITISEVSTMRKPRDKVR
jgi:hypothetical protein